MAEIMIKDTVDALKEIVDRGSPKYLSDKPYQVYTELIESGSTDGKTAAALLHLLANGILETTDPGQNAEDLSAYIQRECSLNKEMADKLAIILNTLYSEDNQKEWQRKNQAGLSEFLEEEFSCVWTGFRVWGAGDGEANCHFMAEIILKPTDAVSKDNALIKLLSKNPFSTKEKISDLFAQRLREYLNSLFEDYFEEDENRWPVAEDFGKGIENDLDNWCKENGFEFVSCSCKECYK